MAGKPSIGANARMCNQGMSVNCTTTGGFGFSVSRDSPLKDLAPGINSLRYDMNPKDAWLNASLGFDVNSPSGSCKARGNTSQVISALAPHGPSFTACLLRSPMTVVARQLKSKMTNRPQKLHGLR